MFPISSWRESLRSARAARSLRRGLGDICLRRIIGSFSISWCFIWLFSRPFRPEGCGLCCLRCLRPPFRPCCMEWGDRISGMFPIWPFRWERPSGFMKKGCSVWMEGKRFRAVLPATLLCILLVPAAMRERALLLQTGGRGKLQLAANTLFSLWIALFSWPVKRVRPVGRMAGGVLRFFGKNSLYLYLLHPFLYYQTAGRWNLGAAGSFAVAFGSAILGAWLFSLLWKAASAKMSVAGKRGERG